MNMRMMIAAVALMAIWQRGKTQSAHPSVASKH